MNKLIFLLAFIPLLFQNNIAQMIQDTAVQDDSEDTSCTNELIHSYRLYPSNEPTLHDPFYICPYLKHSCCSFDSQKMIQILWIRVSQPRLQRILTHNLSSLEFIKTSFESILEVFGKSKLPQNKKYSAECLQSIDDMQDLVDANLIEILKEAFNNVKIAYNHLYKFKRQFYCDICNRDNHPFFNIVNKKLDFSFSFCQKFATDFSPISYFFHVELVQYFTTIKNYVQCYSNKNFLFLQTLDEFKLSGEDKNTIDNCRVNLVCAPFCQRYSLTDLPDFFIGKKEHLDRMVFFLKHHRPDNRGYFISEPDYVKKYNEMLLQEHLENLRDTGSAVDSQDEDDLNSKMFFEQENLKRDYHPGNAQQIEEALMDIYKNSFQFFRTKFVKTKMISIRKRVAEEYDDKMVRQNFIVSNGANIILDEYRTRLMEEGLDPYLLLDKERIYITNANLTLFTKEISNVVPDLLYLNETKIMDEMIETGKLMQTDSDAKDAIATYIKNKVFDKDSESNQYILENPYIDTRLWVGRFGLTFVWILAALFLRV